MINVQKIIFFDIDGTLLHKDKVHEGITNTVRNQLDRLKECGYLLFIASGRPRAMLNFKFLNYDFDGYVIANGNHIIYKNETIYENRLGYDETKHLISFLDTIDCEHDFETNESLYIDGKSKKLISFFESMGIVSNKLKYDLDYEKLFHETIKMEMLLKDPQDEKKVKHYLAKHFSYDDHGSWNSIEIFPKKSSKAHGIEILIEQLKLESVYTYGFGDGLNDIEMIQAVDWGVAMGNANEALKKVANEVIDDINNDGLPKALSKLK